MPTRATDTLSPSLLSAVRRFRRIVVTLTVVAALIALIYTGLAGMSYAGKAGLVITQPPTYLPPFPVSGSHSTLAAYVNQQVALLQSQGVADDAAAIVDKRIAGATLTGKQLHAATSVRPQSSASAGTNPTTEVVVTLATPELAAAGANAVVESYIQQEHAQISAQAKSSVAALNQQISKVTSQLDGLPSPTPPASTNTAGTTPTTRVRTAPTTTTHPARSTTTHPPQTTTTHLHTTTTHNGGSTTSSSAEALRHNAIQLTAFRATVTTTTIGGLTTTTVPSSTSSSSSSSNSATDAQRSVLLSTLINLSRSKTQVEVDEQADLSSQPQTYPATIPSSSSNNNLLRNTVIGALVGLLFGVILAYAIAVRRRQFENADEPELVYRVPLMAQVPAFHPSPWLPVALPVMATPHDESAEAFRIIATALRAYRGGREALLVAFSAASPRSGTTAVVANTGLALAEMGERVLVIDGDPIGRGLTRTLVDSEVEPTRQRVRMGFSEVIGGRALRDTAIAADTNHGLMVLPSGLDPQLAINRWSPQAIRLALGDAKDQFDIILIDVPPVGSSSYGLDLAGASDHMVMVIPFLDAVADHEALPDRLVLGGIDLLGYIFNGAPTTNHYSPYVPILHTQGKLQPASLAPERAELVAATTAKVGGTQSPVAPPPPPPTPPSDDITGIVPAVSTQDPTSEELQPADSGDVTREIPRVEPDATSGS
jgi:Mrp family chromosome partitioning ATPase